MKKYFLAAFAIYFGLHAEAQNFSQYKSLPDSAYLQLEEYREGNKYQRDAILFMDMLADTHPYYVTKSRQQALMAKRPGLLKACGTCSSDTVFVSLLFDVLGKLHDKHTDLIDTLTYRQKKTAAAQKQREKLFQIDLSLMAKHNALFDYTMRPQESICYLQFNQCADARTMGNAAFPRFDELLERMFVDIDSLHIHTLVVDVQYNNGGSSMLCDELLSYLFPLDQLKQFSTYLRFSNLMAMYNPRVATAKQAWEADGHAEELYSMPAGRIPKLDRKIFSGQVVFVQSSKTYSSAGMLMTLARDNHIGDIIGDKSTFMPSHYGEILPFCLPNTGVIGSICCKYFERPDASVAEEEVLVPTKEIDTDDKEALWNYIVRTYGQK